MADSISEKPSTVSKWKKRGRIPENAWQPIIEKAAVRRQFLTVEDFIRLNVPAKPRGGGAPSHRNHRASA